MQKETQGNRNPFLLLTSSETARFGGAGLFLLRANFLQESIRSTGLYIHEHRHGTAASASSLRRLRMSLGRLNLRRRPVIRTPSMATHMRLVLHLLLLFLFAVQEVRLVCVNVESDKEAIVGRPMKLTCIYCMKREEISAETIVEWTYNVPNKTAVPIYLYDHGPQEPEDVDLQWKGRLTWNGSKDLQDLSISIQNVTLNDTGRYECKVSRFFKFDSFELSRTKIIIIDLVVKTEASQDIAAMYSEIMMYVLLVFLTFWLLVEMIYCYRKISKSDELAQDTATDYLAIPSENKENPGPAVTE